MDVYVLDEFLRRTAIIDQYESFIWTERWREMGDFELVIRSDRGTRALLTDGTHLAIGASWRVMVVDTVLNGVNDDGIAILTVTGKSLERILEDRIAMSALLGLEFNPKWFIQGPPADIIRHIFRIVCELGTLSPNDTIPFYVPGALLTPGTIPEPSEIATVGLEPDTMYATIKRLCDLYNLGFRLVRNGDLSQIYFEVYTGDDRTTLQTLNTPVVFSPELDNMTDTKELTSSADFKNIAYVFGKHNSVKVLAEGTQPNVSGFDRRILMVKASDIEVEFETDPPPVGSPEGTEVEPTAAQIAAGWAAYDAALIQRGKEELATHRPVNAYDGEITQNGSYLYGRDYDLGDLVETHNADGLATNMRVTEQIFISDAEGVRSYPTLTIDLLITPGSWLSWDASQVWDDADEMWEDA